MNNTVEILWVDDEIDLLKPHLMFLESKGYNMHTCNNGFDALELLKNIHVDLILLDENMPGLSGLDVLGEVKSYDATIPVVMITKNEEEDIMDEAIGAQIADYLIKPVNPKQILLCIKKNIDKIRLVSQKTTSVYQSKFSILAQEINNCNSIDQWCSVYKKIVYWELELSKIQDSGMEEILNMQKQDANNLFARFVKKNYLDWIEYPNDEETPTLPIKVFKEKVFPHLDEGEKVVFILIDNLRYDQWLSIYPLISLYFKIDKDELMCSILPTATQYARNAMFSGLMPLEIQNIYPDLWIDELDQKSKNIYEKELIQSMLDRHKQNKSLYFHKIFNSKESGKILNNVNSILENDLSVLVYNFIDMLSHARTDSDMIKELAINESAYRSLSLSWFEHSSLFELIKKLSTKDVKLIITTDHGSIKVHNPIKVVGDRDTSTNLRYKQGKNLNYNKKQVFEIIDPIKAKLPVVNVSTSYIFAMGDDFMAYPNNYNYYCSYYKNTFQHGGISLEEMLVPLVSLSPR